MDDSLFLTFISKSTCHTAVRALVLSRLDYCNSLFSVLSQRDLDCLQRLQNSAARLVFSAPLRTHIQPRLELHWLPVQQRIAFKNLLLVFKSLNHRCPPYIAARLVCSPRVRKSTHHHPSGSLSVSLRNVLVNCLSHRLLQNFRTSYLLLCRRPHQLTTSSND